MTAEKAKTVYLDGTFKVVKKQFVQLFSTHAFVHSNGNMKQFPLIFVLMLWQGTKDCFQGN